MIDLWKEIYSAHRLVIERGRYTGTNIDERQCNHASNVTEDEPHFLFECEKCEVVWNNMFKTIHNTDFVLTTSLKEKKNTKLLSCDSYKSIWWFH